MNTRINYPTRVHVELTSKCNFKCYTCKHGYVNYGTDISDKVVDVILNELLPNLQEIELQGTGESLLFPKFVNFFSKLSNNSMLKKTLITNASLLTDEIIDLFVNNKMDLIISLDGTSPDIFSLNRPKGDFNKIIENLSKVGAKRRLANNPNFSFIINMVATQENYKCIMDLIDLAKDIQIDYVHISEVRECMPDTNVWNKLRLDNYVNRKEFEEYIDECKEYSQKNNIGFLFNKYQKSYMIKKPICKSPWQHVFIDSDGRVSFCCEQNKYFGNLNEQSFDEIWNGVQANQFRNDMLLNEYDEICCNCCLPWGITYD